MIWNALLAACNAITILTRISDWKCKPVLVLTFPDIKEYARAEMDIARALAEQPLYPSSRQTMDHVSSLEVMGIKIRLDCPARYMTSSGPRSGVDMIRDGSLQINPIPPGAGPVDN